MWKKGLLVFLILTLTLGLAGQALAAGSIEFVLNGQSITKNMPAQPMFGKIFVPLKYITEKMGGQYTWDSQGHKATVQLNGNTSTIKTGETFVMVNGVHRWMDFPAYNLNNEVLVTLYAVKTALNVDGNWDSNKGILSISEKKPELLSLKVDGSAGQVILNGTKSMDATSKYLSSTKQVVLTIKNTLNKTGKEKIQVSQGWIKDITINYSALHNETTVVINLNQGAEPRLEKTGQGLILNLNSSASNLGKAKLQDISFTSLEDKDQILFSLQGQGEAPAIQKVFYPTRLVLDFNGTEASLANKTIAVNDEIIKQIRVAQYTPDTTRVVLDLNKDTKYQFSPNSLAGSFLLEVAKNDNPPNWGGASLLNKIIVIDPGHGGHDPGAIGPSGVNEKDVVLPVAKNLYQLLLNAGAKPILTRDKDEFIDLVPRADIANNNKADLFLSIHANSAGIASAGGIETYSYIKATSLEGSKLATSVQNSLVKNLGLLDRGPHTANFSVLRNTQMPAALAELGFISNPREETLLSDPNYQQREAEALFQGLLGYYQE